MDSKSEKKNNKIKAKNHAPNETSMKGDMLVNSLEKI